jgi:hypothetical protein
VGCHSPSWLAALLRPLTRPGCKPSATVASICDHLGPTDLPAFFDRWMAILPTPAAWWALLIPMRAAWLQSFTASTHSGYPRGVSRHIAYSAGENCVASRNRLRQFAVSGSCGIVCARLESPAAQREQQHSAASDQAPGRRRCHH